MKCFIVLSALVAVALAKPGFIHGGAVVAPVAYAHYAGAPIGVDGRVVDTPEVAHAKAEHAAAHVNEKVTLAHEAAKSYAASAVVPAYSAYSAYAAPAVVSAYSAAPAVVPAYSAYSAYPYGKVYSGVSPVVSAYSSYAAVPAGWSGYYAHGHGAPLSLDGRVVDTPEVAHAKAAHFAAHAEAKARLGYGAHYAYAAPAVSVW